MPGSKGAAHVSSSQAALLAPGRLTSSPALVPAPSTLAGRRPAFAMNSITVLGRQSLAELAAEAAELAAAASAAQGLGAAGGPPPSPATIAKSLLAVAVLSMGVPIVPQVRGWAAATLCSTAS